MAGLSVPYSHANETHGHKASAHSEEEEGKPESEGICKVLCLHLDVECVSSVVSTGV